MNNERWRTESGELNRVLGGVCSGFGYFDGRGTRRWQEYVAAAGGKWFGRAKALLIHYGRGELAVALRAKRLKLPVDAVSVAAQTSLEACLNIGMTISPTS